jgi:hypothetical protein
LPQQELSLPQERNLAALGKPVLTLVGFYFLGALYVGVIAGLFHRYATSRVRAGLLGVGYGRILWDPPNRE